MAGGLGSKIRQVHQEHRSVYGSPRMYQALRGAAEVVYENSVARLTRQQEIRFKARKTFVPRTTDARHPQPAAQNLLDRSFAVPSLSRVWGVHLT